MKYLNEYTSGEDTQVTTGSTAINSISAFVLNENKVFIAIHYLNSIKGIVCTVEGASITTGIETVLANIASGNIAVLSENRIFLSFLSGYYLYGSVFEIEENAITLIAHKQLSSLVHSSSPAPLIVSLSSSKVFIMHNSNNQRTGVVYGIVCVISENEITAGKDTVLTNGYGSRLIKLLNEKVFISFVYSNGIARGIACSVLNTTITAGTYAQMLTSESLSYKVSINYLGNDKIFIGHSNSSESYPIYGRICTISGTSISLGTDTKLNSNSNVGKTMLVTVLSENKIFITCTAGSSNSKQLYGMLCEVTGTTITVKVIDRQLSNIAFMSDSGNYYAVNLTVISDNRICILFKYQYSVYGQSSYPINLDMIICEIDEDLINIVERVNLSNEASSFNGVAGICTPNGNIFIRYIYLTYTSYMKMIKKVNLVLPITSPTDDIYGVAKDNGEEDAMVDVYRPLEGVAV